MKNYFSALMVMLISVNTIHAKITKANQIVYLNDGRILKGTTTIIDSGYTRIVSDDSINGYFKKSQISKVEDAPAPKTPKHNYDLKTRGYVCSIEFGGTDIMAKDGGGNLSLYSFDVVNSFLISPYGSIGFGIGTALSSSGFNTEMLSVYAHGRVYFMKSNISPYLDLALGYNGMFIKYTINDVDGYYIPVNTKETDHGMMFNPALGIRVAVGKKLALTAGIGYKLYYLNVNNSSYYFSQYRYNYSYNYYNASGNATFKPDGNGHYFFNALSIKAGFEF